MKVALTIWEDRISPVFDSAHTLLVLEFKSSELVSRSYETFNPERISRFADILVDRNVSVLICGAISESPASVIINRGIELIPFITGKTEEVVTLYSREKKITPAFLMPGCRMNHNRQRGKRGGGMNMKNGNKCGK